MQIGLTPVRHALRRLALENLVVILPRRGTLVADLNPADLSKLFEMRIELEALAAQLAALRIRPAQAQALVELACETRAAQMQARAMAGATREPLLRLPLQPQSAPIVQPESLAACNEQLIRLDQRMHRLLAEAAHNEFLLETLDWLYSHVLRLWNTGLQQVTALEQSMEEHCQVADAVLAGESEHAATLMRAHVRHFQQAFLESTALPAPGMAHRTEPVATPNRAA
jgi:DNA-binding GntR family transcriptional regulator